MRHYDQTTFALISVCSAVRAKGEFRMRARVTRWAEDPSRSSERVSVRIWQIGSTPARALCFPVP